MTVSKASRYPYGTNHFLTLKIRRRAFPQITVPPLKKTQLQITRATAQRVDMRATRLIGGKLFKEKKNNG